MTKEDPSRFIGTGTGAWLGIWDPENRVRSDPGDDVNQRTALSRADRSALVIVTIVALIVRCINLHNPPNAIFEEPVVGGYVNRYIRGNFFIDVEPPLPGLMYFYLAKWLGYQGTFDFGPVHQSFIGSPFPYYQLRLFNALMGVGTVVLTFLLLKLNGIHRKSAVLGSCLVIFENSYVTQHRYIFTVPFLLFFVALSLYSYKRVELARPFGLEWFTYLVATGLSLGGACSSRNSGSYMAFFIVGLNLYQLWWTCVDLKLGWGKILGHCVVRTTLLAGLPILVYTGVVMHHLQLTPKSGDGDSFMPGRFQAGLINNERPPVAANVSLGSLVTIRHHSTYGFLHSHDFYYETGSQQQQVTLYGYRDLNNVWMVDGLDQPKEGEPQPFEMAPSNIEDGAFVRLKHMNSNRYLHTHGHKAPVSENDWQTEVSAYGADGYPGDLNDLWKVELVPQFSEQLESWQALATMFRLQHVISGCYLFSHPTKLPKWGFEQSEVTCAQSGIVENSLWYVETNYHPKFESTDPKDYIQYTEMTMAEKYVAYVDSMLKVARQFGDKAEGASFWKVDAFQLPLLVTGLSYFRHDHRQVYLFGNLITWWCSIGCIVGYLSFKIAVLIIVQRGHRSTIENIKGVAELDHIVGQLIAGWLAFYLPLWSKQHEITDYLPALYFSILAFVAIWDFRLKRWRPLAQYIITAAVIAIVAYFFYVLSPLSYGTRWLRQDCESWQMRGNWKFYCDYQLETPAEYDVYDREHFGSTYVYIKPPREEPPEDTATLFEGYLEPEYSNSAIWKEFEAMEYTPSNSVLDLTDQGVQRVLLAELERRNMTVEDYALKRALSESEELEAEVGYQVNEELESRIAAQWARITDPPKFNSDEETATLADSSVETAIPVDGDPEESVD